MTASQYVPLGLVASLFEGTGWPDWEDELINALHEDRLRTIADRYITSGDWKPMYLDDTPPPPCAPVRSSVPPAYWEAQWEELLLGEAYLRIRNGDAIEVYEKIKVYREDLDRIWAELKGGDAKIPDPIPPRSAPGPVSGTTGYYAQDVALIPEFEVLRKKSRSKNAAASELANQGKLAGGGTAESRKRRFLMNYNRHQQKLVMDSALPTKSK